MPLTALDVANRLQSTVLGEPNRPITGAAILEDAAPDQIAYIKDAKKIAKGLESAAGTLLIPPAAVEKVTESNCDKSLIVVDDPQEAFLQLVAHFHPEPTPVSIGISEHAFVAPTAKIGEETDIHPTAVIEDGVEIGARCVIHPGAVIGRGSRIGNDCVLYPHVVLYPGMQLADRVVIHACSVIGADGFGYRQIKGEHVKIPHYGTVIIEDDVEIGACTTIDRSFLGATRIGRGSKIDNQVMIGHNCNIGRHNILVSHVGFAGSVSTGDYVICAGQVGVADHVHIGDGAVLGAKCGVHKDLPGGVTYLGTPATPESETIRQVMALRKLPELRTKVKELETQIQQLQEQLRQQLNDDRSQCSAA
ncbi:MAG TPA: UDP-3-O-(3-hydroxymyristoyl)glucosamine N-acyltransferase [Planctomycetaceae bacterium]|nr:UDP-3-O-(3-hydroxymyristoyl)glucosamine N-acyltransferase [Planctomycetaceae bacterium]